MFCFIRKKERSLAFVSNGWVAIFQKPLNGTSEALITLSVISHEEFQELSDFEPLYGEKPIHGILGTFYYSFGNGNGSVFICVVRSAKLVLQMGMKEPTFQIQSVDFVSLDHDVWDDSIVNGDSDRTYELYSSSIQDHPNPTLGDRTILSSTKVIEYHPLASLSELLTDGTFYASPDISCFTRVDSDTPSSSWEIYCWNRFMIREVATHFEEAQIGDKLPSLLLRCFRGYVESYDNSFYSMAIISKLSSYGSQQTYPPSGLDDDAFCSLFVETEFVVQAKKKLASFLQVRGTVPCFWEQEYSSWYGGYVSFTTSEQASQGAFNRHFRKLQRIYKEIFVLDLLDEGKVEGPLKQAYKHHLMLLPFPAVTKQFHIALDANKSNFETGFKKIMRDALKDMSFYLHNYESDLPSSVQNGVIRTNDIDCLGRTNLAQWKISEITLKDMFNSIKADLSEKIREIHGQLWSNNGDAIAKLVTGVGSIGSSISRRGYSSLAGSLSDLTKSFGRMYLGRFPDEETQNTMLYLLGAFLGQRSVLIADSMSTYVQGVLHQRHDEYVTHNECSLYTTTFNTNGKVPSMEDFKKWLFPYGEHTPVYDLYVLGIQELVNLNIGHLVNTSSQRMKLWEEKILQTVNSNIQNIKYVLISSAQMTGVFLTIFVREDKLNAISKVSKATRKTGFGGFTANKGAVAIELNFFDTDMCFISSHFAPKTNNVMERNMEYASIVDGLVFSSGMKIYDHSNIIWLGDFNYRIDADNDDVRKLIEVGDLSKLYSFDQLRKEMDAKRVFLNLTESQLTFYPSYKFDNGTDDYDTSEKQRVPSWTDRILSTKNNIRTAYTSINVRCSDHRPVISTFILHNSRTDKDKEAEIIKEARNAYITSKHS
ncbi:inositol-polyphosphate 5-phosphatase [Schizosaccharomyces cryophilus OY26]|uniref:phosphoinositide 5-phosphatase n=1 Tax=Schizosaccharomyces cryophilus (strain OY26 / ATCC MYA-4695 / CBS 11777 / NBRC 106824 / NRRL Y48691) TaxID=653667 RepID=S9WXQ5_SCHCR|nr:inositol-polyphosphate 5-phosphatase [Schizosaccharomyces cryophilus OY26]EPY49482.1 inositol-polyphosphate 5-phosphatase [Schizosaccharomyces cryophilus OY26]